MKARGVVRVPGDKSISHRSLILAALATGRSRIAGILDSADVNSTASVLRSLGVAVPDLTSDFSLSGKGLRGLNAPGSPLYCGNSGTTVRLMSGVLAAHPFESRLEGDASLSRRPMKRIAEPLTAMGARFEFARGDGLPMTIHGGRLAGITWNTRSASAQTKSAILLAGLVGGVQVTVIESQKSRDHTERILTSLGAAVESDETSVSLSPVSSLSPLELTVPGDPSSAAYFIAYAVLGGGEISIPGVCINPTRAGFIDTLIEMGGKIECEDRAAAAGDSVATIVARKSSLNDFTVSGSRIPSMIDELPLLACVAAYARIRLEVRGAQELRVKESDRIAVVAQNLRALGVDIEELNDGFIVRGRSGPLAGRIITEGDHRIAMSFGVLAALPGSSIEIDDPACVSVSYPAFWDDLKSLQR
jgi:3-phosphoshikimate 1-carboxyvinyltransferase